MEKKRPSLAFVEEFDSSRMEDEGNESQPDLPPSSSSHDGYDMRRNTEKIFLCKVWFVDKSFLISLFIQVLMMVGIYGARAAAPAHLHDVRVHSWPLVLFSFFLQATQMVIVLQMAVALLKDTRARTISIWFLFKAYVATCLSYAGIYFLIFFAISDQAFRNMSSSLDPTHVFYHIFLFVECFYFSLTTMSTVGFGDLSPDRWYSIIVVMSEQMVSILYSAIIFSMGISHFVGLRRVVEEEKQQAGLLVEDEERGVTTSQSMRGETPLPVEAFDDVLSPRSSRHAELIQTLANKGLYVAVGIQFVVVALLYIPGNLDSVAISLMIFVQVLALLFVVFMSYKLVDDVRGNHLSKLFLLKSFLCTTCSFAGLYVICYRADPEAFAGVPPQVDGEENAEPMSPPEVALRFAYFSNTVMSTVGFGDIIPTSTLTRSIAALQQLTSVVYSAVIFAGGLC